MYNIISNRNEYQKQGWGEAFLESRQRPVLKADNFNAI
jgi:hypothetical protein